MANQKLAFEDFILTVDYENREFVHTLHQMLINCGCKIEVKEAKSGYLVSYLLNKRTILNYVFRKKGLIIRIYANHLGSYLEFLDTLPDGMIKTIREAPLCKRLVTPGTCNSKCAMGYDFLLRGEHFQKCRNSAFMFLLCNENNSFIETFLKNELEGTPPPVISMPF